MSHVSRFAFAAVLAAAGFLSGCQTLHQTHRESVTPVRPADNEMMVLNELYIIVDASGSMFPAEKYHAAKTLVKRMGGALPDDSYAVQLNTFGGEWRMDWLNMPLDAFNRKKFLANADRVTFLSGMTPLSVALDDLAPALKDGRGHSAVLILSDGMSDANAAVASARALLSEHPGELCFHTVHFGCEAQGAALLQGISGLTDCGTSREADCVASNPGLEALVHDMFYGVKVDSDNDGVADAYDLCPDTPAGVAVNLYGCPTWATVYFDTNKSALKKQFKKTLDEVAARLANTPGACLRVEGHTDSRNEIDYNQRLSQGRVSAVRDALIKRGVEPGRLITTGFGELRPAAPNTSAQNMSLNRRVELIPLP